MITDAGFWSNVTLSVLHRYVKIPLIYLKKKNQETKLLGLTFTLKNAKNLLSRTLKQTFLSCIANLRC